MPYLEFISDEKLIKCVMQVIDGMTKAGKEADQKIYKNAIDPFSAVFDVCGHGLSLDEWLALELKRQVQKTMQNTIGDFHQDILGAMHGWENLGVGKIIDLCNKKEKIIAEVKNKHNTTKGNHRTHIYDDLEDRLSKPDRKNFTGYYVEVIPKGKKKYDKPFTPSDNKTKKRRPINEHIRQIDGITFYNLASGQKDALRKLYSTIPKVIQDQTKKSTKELTDDPLFFALFNGTYQ